jgi:hypothetical protein
MYCRYLVINELIFFSLHSIIVNFFLGMETLKKENNIFLTKNIYYKCCFLVGYFVPTVRYRYRLDLRSICEKI